MKKKIYDVLKHSAVYSFGNIALKGMGIITLPIYANYLTQAEFGVFAILDITLQILTEVLSLGQSNSIILFNNKAEYQEKKKSVFFTIMAFVLSANVLFIFIAEIFGVSILNYIKPESNFTAYLPILVIVVFIRVINSVFINKVRADEKSLYYTVITIIKIIFFIALIFLFVVYLKKSIVGIIYSYLFSELIILGLMLPSMIKEMVARFDKEVMKSALKFGFPLIFSTIGILILNLSDRYLIGSFVNLKSVGLYHFGYSIAGVLQMFLIMPFNQALLPLVYKEYKTPNDKRYYGKLMTYMCFVIIWGGLALSMFSSSIVKVLGNNNFNGAEAFVPIIILAYIFSAMRAVASTGILLTEKTSYIGITTVAAGILNIILNIIFIPIYGVMVAAYTTLISFIIFYIITKIISDRFYEISYESKKIFNLFLVGIILFIISEILNIDGIVLFSLIKLLIVIAFPFIMYFLKFYEKIELQTIKASLGKLKISFDWKKIITSIIKNEK